MGLVPCHRWLWDGNWLNICGGLYNNSWTCEVFLCWMWPFEAVKDFMHPSLRKRRVENSSGGEEEGRSRGRLTDGLSEWIIDRGLLTDAASINSSKPVWWITADKQCWVSKCVFNKARWKYYSLFSQLQTSKQRQLSHSCSGAYEGTQPSHSKA